MVKRTSNKGKVIDFDSLIAQNQDEPAMGNMKVNAKGDVIGKMERLSKRLKIE